MKNFILQAVTEQNHVSAVKALLGTADMDKFIISTAFMTESGLSILEESLRPVADKTTIFVGIRNGVSTYQSLEKATNIGCTVFAVDTGSRSPIFHPKLYFGHGDKCAELIVGSANLTMGGLNSNIEASLYQKLELTAADDAQLSTQIITQFDAMVADYPEHVIKIENKDQIDDLLKTGRVIDEGGMQRPSASASSASREGDVLGRMKLKTKPIRRPRAAAAKPMIKPVKTEPKTVTGRAVAPTDSGLELLWESSPLARRDLDIPVSENTNPTGSMLFKKGNSDIDQQTYFRAEVFNGLEWRENTRTAGKELADADFQFIIRGIDYGVHRMIVTNDTRTNTSTYKQKQPMSEIRWGEARHLIARDDLLERTMRLYRDPDDATLFVIDID
jgi:HKD family nuclease